MAPSLPSTFWAILSGPFYSIGHELFDWRAWLAHLGWLHSMGQPPEVHWKAGGWVALLSCLSNAEPSSTALTEVWPSQLLYHSCCCSIPRSKTLPFPSVSLFSYFKDFADQKKATSTSLMSISTCPYRISFSFSFFPPMFRTINRFSFWNEFFCSIFCPSTFTGTLPWHLIPLSQIFKLSIALENRS